MSPDRLVAVSISADRTTEAIEFPLDDYTVEATEALTGFKDFEVGKARPFKAHYEAEAVEATGTAKGRVRQRLQTDRDAAGRDRHVRRPDRPQC